MLTTVFPAPASPARLAELEELVERWLAAQLESSPAVASVERVEASPPRWYVRMEGEEKATFSVLLTLGQRTLAYESYLMPSPQRRHGELYEHLLRRNLSLYGLALAIGDEDAIFLVGHLDVRHLDEGELDRILGSVYEATERFFRPAMRIGFDSPI